LPITKIKLPLRLDGGDHFIAITKKGTIVIGPKLNIKGFDVHWTAHTNKDGFYDDHVTVKLDKKVVERKTYP